MTSAARPTHEEIVIPCAAARMGIERGGMALIREELGFLFYRIWSIWPLWP